MDCVMIMKNEDGTFTVSECEPMPSEGAQPVQSVDEAAQLAVQMLTGVGDEGESEVKNAIQGGYDKVAGGRMGPPRGAGAMGNKMFGEE